MSLVTRKHLVIYKKKTEQLIHDLGNIITIMTKDSSTKCNNCVYDETHKCSSGLYNKTGPKPFKQICPVCNGKGIIIKETKKNITAICKYWIPTDTDQGFKKEKFGVEELGLLKVKAKIDFKDDFKNASYFIFNGERFKLKTDITSGMKDHIVFIAWLERENV